MDGWIEMMMGGKGGLRAVGKAAKVRRDVLDFVIDLDGGLADGDVGVPEVDVGVVAGLNPVVGVDDVPDPLGDEVVEGVDVLLDEAPDLEECREERELVDGAGDRRGQRAVGRWWGDDTRALVGRVVALGGNRHGGGGGGVGFKRRPPGRGAPRRRGRDGGGGALLPEKK